MKTRCLSLLKVSRCAVYILSSIFSQGWGSEGARQVVETRLKDLLQSLATKSGGSGTGSGGGGTGGTRGAKPGEIVEHLFAIHACMPRASPRDLSALIDSYKSVYTAKETDLNTQMSHLSAGVDKLRGAAQTVDELSKKAEEQRRLLTQKQKASGSEQRENFTLLPPSLICQPPYPSSPFGRSLLFSVTNKLSPFHRSS
jgi:hypothetical protein